MGSGVSDYFSLLKIYLTFLHNTLKGSIVAIIVHMMPRGTLKRGFLLIHDVNCPHFRDNRCYWALFFTCFFQKHYMHINNTYMCLPLLILYPNEMMCMVLHLLLNVCSSLCWRQSHIHTFFLNCLQCSWMYHNLVNLSSTHGHLSCFQFSAFIMLEPDC